MHYEWHLNMSPVTAFSVNARQLLIVVTCTLCWQKTFLFWNNYILYFVDIDDCKGNPCKNCGICTDGVDTYTCECANGYTGDNCDTSMLDYQWNITRQKTSEIIQQILTYNYVESTKYAELLSNVYWFRVGITTITSKQNVIVQSISQHSNLH